jgi:hypothetical protein
MAAGKGLVPRIVLPVALVAAGCNAFAGLSSGGDDSNTPSPEPDGGVDASTADATIVVSNDAAAATSDASDATAVVDGAPSLSTWCSQFDAATTVLCADFDRSPDAAASWSYGYADGGGSYFLTPSFLDGGAPAALAAKSLVGSPLVGVQRTSVPLGNVAGHGIALTGRFSFPAMVPSGSANVTIANLELGSNARVSLVLDGAGNVSCSAFGDTPFSAGIGPGTYTFKLTLTQQMTTGLATSGGCAFEGTFASGITNGALYTSAAVGIGVASAGLTGSFEVHFDDVVVTTF